MKATYFCLLIVFIGLYNCSIIQFTDESPVSIIDYDQAEEDPFFTDGKTYYKAFHFCIPIDSQPLELSKVIFQVEFGHIYEKEDRLAVSWSNTKGFDIDTSGIVLGFTTFELFNEDGTHYNWKNVFGDIDDELRSSLSGTIYSAKSVTAVSLVVQGEGVVSIGTDDLKECRPCNSFYDMCGVCKGDGSKCEDDLFFGCDGVEGSDVKLDSCGVCGGDNACIPKHSDQNNGGHKSNDNDDKEDKDNKSSSSNEYVTFNATIPVTIIVVSTVVAIFACIGSFVFLTLYRKKIKSSSDYNQVDVYTDTPGNTPIEVVTDNQTPQGSGEQLYKAVPVLLEGSTTPVMQFIPVNDKQ